MTVGTVDGCGSCGIVSTAVLQVLDGMDGILACLVDMAVTAIQCTVMFLFGMTVLAVCAVGDGKGWSIKSGIMDPACGVTGGIVTIG